MRRFKYIQDFQELKHENKYTIQDCIKEFGEPPICKCNECRINKIKVKIYPSEYRRYKKQGYPILSYGHTSKNKKMTSEIEKEICKLYKEGQSTSIIGIKYCVSSTTVYRYLIKNNVNIRYSCIDYYKLNKRLNLNKDERGWYSLNPYIGNGKRLIRGYERHHVNQNDIIYVPTEYNQNIPHNVDTGFNMEIVNTVAYFFLIMCNIKDLNKIFMKF